MKLHLAKSSPALVAKPLSPEYPLVPLPANIITMILTNQAIENKPQNKKLGNDAFVCCSKIQVTSH